jgi:threonine dehydratase
MEEQKIPNLNDIREAYRRIKNKVHHTPVLTSRSINRMTGAELYFKCENFQRSGAFKFRGACNGISHLLDKGPVKTIATHSSGNHAGALALAASEHGVRCIVVMPSNSSKIKINAVQEYGAKIVFCLPTLQARETELERVQEQTGASPIHPYNNFHVIAGQGTAALELIREVVDLDCLIAPVGGGGLLSGTAIAVKSLHPGISVYGAEPKGADDAYRSFKEKHIVPSVNPKTIADGLLTSLSDLTFSIITSFVDEILTVTETGILQAMKLLWERMKIVVEPSGCVPLAALLENKSIFAKKKTGIILSGGNIDPEIVSRIHA